MISKDGGLKFIGLVTAMFIIIGSIEPLISHTAISYEIDPEEFGGSDIGSGQPCDEDNWMKIKIDAVDIDGDITTMPDNSEDPTDHIEQKKDVMIDNGMNIPVNPNIIGYALHMDITLGNIYTILDICPGVSIRYNSINRDIVSALGHGWTHTNNIYLFLSGQDVVIVDGDGLFTTYRYSDNGFVRPPQRKMDLFYEDGDDADDVPDHYVLKYFDGSKIEFRTTASADGRYYIERFVTTQGNIYQFNYNGGLLTSIYTSYDKNIYFGYMHRENGEIRLSSIRHVDGKYTLFRYNNQDDLAGVVDPKGKTTRYFYDDQHRLIREILKNGVIYDAQYIVNPDGSEEQAIFDFNPATEQGSIVYRIVSDHQGFASQRPVYYPNDGVVTLYDGNGNQKRFTRNRYGQITQIEVQNDNGDFYVYRRYEYHDSDPGKGMLYREWDANGWSSSPKYYKEYIYDSYNNLVSFTNEKGEIVTYEYNDIRYPGLMTGRIRGGVHWSYEYDEYGRLINENVIIQNPEPHQYTRTYSYEFYGDPSEGKLRSINMVDRNGHVRKVEYDEHGRLTALYSYEGANKIDETVFEYEDWIVVVYGWVLVQKNNYEPPKHEWHPIGRILNGTIVREITPTGRFDARGNEIKYTTEYFYDTLGNLVKKTISGSSNPITESFTYDERGNILTYKDGRGFITKYIYDHRDRLISLIYAYGTNEEMETSFSYDNANNLISITEPGSGTRQFFYNRWNQLYRTVDGEEYITRYLLDLDGNIEIAARGLYQGHEPLLHAVDPLSYKIKFEYDELDRIISIRKDIDHLVYDNDVVTRFNYVSGLGGCSSCGTDLSLIHYIVDAEGKYTYYYYDDLERLIKKVQKVNDIADNGGDEDDIIYELEYDNEGNLIRAIGPMGEVTGYQYDSADRLIRVILDPSGLNLVTTYRYNKAELTKITMPNGNSVRFGYDWAGRLTSLSDNIGDLGSIQYDANGNIVWIRDPLGRITTISYDSVNRPVRISKNNIYGIVDTYSYSYDNSGLQVVHTAPNQVRTKYEYNKLGWLRRVIRDYFSQGQYIPQTHTSTANTVTEMIYNGLGLVEWVIDPLGNPTRYVYDALGDLREIRYADDLSGTGDDHVSFVYDRTGNLVSRTDQNGNTINYIYDDLHRVKDIVYPDLPEIQGYTDSYVYDKSSRLLSASNQFSTTTFTYDVIGRVMSNTQINTGQSPYTTLFDYTIGNPTSSMTMTYPDTRSIIFSYDARSRLTSISSPGVSGIFTYNNGDELTNMILGSNNNIVSTFSYDAIGRLTEINHKHYSTSVYHDIYGYDNNGNRVFTRKLSSSGSETGNSELYRYDALDRLVDFGRGVLTTHGDNIASYTSSTILKQLQIWLLDRNGNWLTNNEQVNGEQMTETRTPNTVNEYTDIPDGAYDNNGNLLNDGTYEYVYDATNRLIKIKQDGMVIEGFKYDALGRRVISESNGAQTHHIYNGLVEIQERNTNGVLIREYVPGAAGILAMINTGMDGKPYGIYYYLQDILGSTVALTDSNGAIVERYLYEPYGETFITDNNGNPRIESAYGNRFMWTGQWYDATTGLYHFYARSYSPSLGRWLQRDPLGYVDGLNLYQYVGSNPMSFIDPYGLWGEGTYGKHEQKQKEYKEKEEKFKEQEKKVKELENSGVSEEEIKKEKKELREMANELEKIKDEIAILASKLGHSDFPGHELFDYNLADKKRLIGPIWGILGHTGFNIKNITALAEQAARRGDKNLFAILLHFGQDYFTHPSAIKHIGMNLILMSPDDPLIFWLQYILAYRWTIMMLNVWFKYHPQDKALYDLIRDAKGLLSKYKFECGLNLYKDIYGPEGIDKIEKRIEKIKERERMYRKMTPGPCRRGTL
ncbi:MAG: RHS repeat-associated core domain-containing protein [Candidatus Thermoplasmatota archaeon]